jgi:hypothetical protein
MWPASGENPSECTLGQLDRAIADSQGLTLGIVEKSKNNALVVVFQGGGGSMSAGPI